MPLAARLSRLTRRWAKRSAGNPRLYPYLKLAQMLFQDDAAVAIGRRYRTAAMVCDGNLLLSATGRAGNYRTRRERATPADLAAAYRHLLSSSPLVVEAASRLPALGTAATPSRSQLPCVTNGARRETTSPLSGTDRQRLAEGYSAGSMRVIYHHDRQAQGIPDRVFFGYPLHRAGYDRLQILVDRLRPKLEAR